MERQPPQMTLTDTREGHLIRRFGLQADTEQLLALETSELQRLQLWGWKQEVAASRLHRQPSPSACSFSSGAQPRWLTFRPSALPSSEFRQLRTLCLVLNFSGIGSITWLLSMVSL